MSALINLKYSFVISKVNSGPSSPVSSPDSEIYYNAAPGMSSQNSLKWRGFILPAPLIYSLILTQSSLLVLTYREKSYKSAGGGRYRQAGEESSQSYW